MMKFASYILKKLYITIAFLPLVSVRCNSFIISVGVEKIKNVESTIKKKTMVRTSLGRKIKSKKLLQLPIFKTFPCMPCSPNVFIDVCILLKIQVSSFSSIC